MIYGHSAFQGLFRMGIIVGNAVRFQFGIKLTHYSGFNLAGGDMFSVVRHLVQFPGFFTERKPASILKGALGIWTIYAPVRNEGGFF
jgi:hypothetical protein